MNKIKKYLLYSLILIVLWIVFALSYGIYNLLGKELGKGYVISTDKNYNYLTSESLKELILYGILDYNYNEKYIILAKLKGSAYTCKNADKFIFAKKIQYVIIDKHSGKIISTENEEKFEKKKTELNIRLKVDSSDSFEKTIKKVRKSNIDKNILECEDVNTYPINSY